MPSSCPDTTEFDVSWQNGYGVVASAVDVLYTLGYANVGFVTLDYRTSSRKGVL